MKIEKFSKIKNCHCARVSFFFFLVSCESGCSVFLFAALDNDKGDRLVDPPVVT